MSLNVRDTQLVFRDLSDALSDLKKESNSPVDVRRAFGRFLTLTQQLTETMRKEYKRITGSAWSASAFTKWNSNTELFKELRKSDYHEFPVVINVRESQHYAEILEDQFGNEYNGFVVASVTWGLGDPFSEEIPNSMRAVGYDSDMKPVEDLKPEKVDYEFILNPRTEKIRKAIDLAGSDNIHVLSEECFKVLEEYYNYYTNSIDEYEKNKKFNVV